MGTKIKVVAALAATLVFGVAGIAHADIVQNEIVAGSSSTITAGGNATVAYRITTAPANDAQSGCNAADSTPATVAINAPPGVTATPSSLVFNSCDVNKTVVFTSATVGNHEVTVTVTDTGSGSYNTNPAKFTLHVTAPTNTAPTVTIGGKPSSPVASNTPGGANVGWGPITVTDTQDDPDPAATCKVGATTVTSPSFFAAGGPYTVVCSATDAGGLSGSDSFTFSVTPNAPPSVAVTGVTDGAAYPKGTVPAAGCQVTDAEDGPQSPAATLSDLTGPYAADDLGSQTASCSYTDASGETGSASATYTIVDESAPSIVPHVVGTLGNNGWYRSDVAVSWSVTDGESTPTLTGCDAVSVIADTAGATYTCTATSAGGTSSSPVTIKRDATAPSVSATPSPAPNANGWNKSAVTVTYTGTDTLSGGVTCDLPTTLATDGADQTATGSCTDAAGNTASATADHINIDTTAPTVTATPSPAPNGNGWNKSPVTVTYNGTDTLSGGVTCDLPTTLTNDGANQTATGSCTDAAGNTASATADDINIDTTAPTATASVSPAANGAGWHKGDVTIDFTAEDDLSGPGSCTPAQTVLTTEGQALSASSTCSDLAGNMATATATGIAIDKTAPTVTATASPAPNANGWNNTPVTVTFSATDALSGVAGCDDAVELGSDGSGQAASGSCRDVAGNANTATASPLNIDRTAPAVALVGGPAHGSTHVFASVPTAPTCSALDGVSGLQGSCVVSGYSTAVGSHTVTATATDRAGNTASASATYTVAAWTLSGFYSPVDMGGVVNTIRGGSTVPLKFEVFAGSTELTATSAIRSFTTAVVPCSALTAASDEIEVTTTGGTSLRYDATGGQFIQNWQTPRAAGVCYRVTMTTLDGSTLVALFKTR